MLASCRVQLNVYAHTKSSQLAKHGFLRKPFEVNIKPLTLQNPTKLRLFASTSDPIIAQDNTPTEKEKLRVVVKPMAKTRIVLKFIWMERALGIGLDQVIPGHGTIPLSAYHFWPISDAWEQLKLLLESKPWISRTQMVILLNQATDIINLWQENGCRSQ
ncbi:hypothetical protein K2173_023149 [Erythroxylum novogranatense]|uniref:30S ribosomal protein 3, chloroplastic n=1 Tax=Erythroxylum novogranatense TaxID=1862640 RepID=A0AAV8UB39_9ROSI|nr:hypothetical protein K2173_023149 [Erythroxylum novogranatense]